MTSTAATPARTPAKQVETEIVWPRKYDLFGVQVSATDYDEMVDVVARAARQRIPAVISMHAVHAIVESISDQKMLTKVNRFDAVAPDGQPVRWALNHLHGTHLRTSVTGRELMHRLCARAAQDSIPIYLYGSTPRVLNQLQQSLASQFPRLRIAGVESPPFRALTPAEDESVVRRINESDAGIVFIGLGCPKQDHFAADHADRIRAVQACVGAAFEFHAGTKPVPPRWMQRYGLEWFYRLASEPRRLWRRYLHTNSVFLGKWLYASLRGPAAPTTIKAPRKPK